MKCDNNSFGYLITVILIFDIHNNNDNTYDYNIQTNQKKNL